MLNLHQDEFSFQTNQLNIILKLPKNIETNKASGIYNIFGKFLKDDADTLANPMTQIRNLSVKLSHFLNNCKLAKPMPVYKKAKTNPKSFQPISLFNQVANHEYISG